MQQLQQQRDRGPDRTGAGLAGGRELVRGRAQRNATQRNATAGNMEAGGGQLEGPQRKRGGARQANWSRDRSWASWIATRKPPHQQSEAGQTTIRTTEIAQKTQPHSTLVPTMSRQTDSFHAAAADTKNTTFQPLKRRQRQRRQQRTTMTMTNGTRRRRPRGKLGLASQVEPSSPSPLV